MKKFSFALIAVTFMLVTAFNSHKTYTRNRIDDPNFPDSKVKAYYFKQCTFCHNQSERIAPYMGQIKRIYLENYPEQNEFVQKISDFVLNPEESKRLYRSESFETMPKEMFHDPDKIKAVAGYIYKEDNL